MAEVVIGFILFMCELLTENRKTAPYALLAIIAIVIIAVVYCLTGV